MTRADPDSSALLLVAQIYHKPFQEAGVNLLRCSNKMCLFGLLEPKMFVAKFFETSVLKPAISATRLGTDVDHVCKYYTNINICKYIAVILRHFP